jgi:hypothetical protein
LLAKGFGVSFLLEKDCSAASRNELGDGKMAITSGIANAREVARVTPAATLLKRDG